jgi:hypothetical protein
VQKILRYYQGDADGKQTFIAQILALDPAANVIAAGDFNEFGFVQPMKTFSAISTMVDLDEAAQIPVEERYT